MSKPEHDSTESAWPVPEALLADAVNRLQGGDRSSLDFLKQCAQEGSCMAFDAVVEQIPTAERVAFAVGYALSGNYAALCFLLTRAQVGDRTAFAFLQGRLREGNRIILSFLVRRAQEHDEAAFTFHYENFKRGLNRYLTGRVGDRDVASGLTQDAFTRAWQELPKSGEETREKFKAWLYRIATNLSVDYFRRARVLMQSLEELEENGTLSIPSAEGPENFVGEKELVQQAFQEVKPRHRDALFVETYLNRSQGEKAQLLEVNENTFSGFVSRGRKELLEALERLVNESETLEGKGPTI
jgi:RNA polymerase sigma-70 factor (ECF subfamily)